MSRKEKTLVLSSEGSSERVPTQGSPASCFPIVCAQAITCLYPPVYQENHLETTVGALGLSDFL